MRQLHRSSEDVQNIRVAQGSEAAFFESLKNRRHEKIAEKKPQKHPSVKNIEKAAAHSGAFVVALDRSTGFKSPQGSFGKLPWDEEVHRKRNDVER